MNSKWQIYRVGLLDFWYYDEEEFYFLDGRMLLRGANGSGKSVTCLLYTSDAADE